MNYSEPSMANSLPQFSELTTRCNVTTIGYPSGESDQLQNSQNIIYSTATDSSNDKQAIHSPNKYSNTIFNWPDSHILIDNEDINLGTLNPQTLTQQSIAMAEYIQKLQSSTLPITLQQLIKIQSEQSKKDKDNEQRNDQIHNNILNIPNVPIIYKTSQMQSDSQYINDHSMMLNPSDVNVHMEEQPENHNNTQNHMQPQKLEPLVQIEVAKPEKKMKFRAKTGEIKMTIALDGSPLYCCPECNLAFAQKVDIEQHLQIHIQERKYQCKECGAMLKRKEHLDQHMRGHSDERPFKCPVCQKAFKRNEHLTRHYVIHSGDKNFSCQVCQKAFSRKDHLNKHTQTHLGIKKVKPKKETIDSKLVKPDMGFLVKESGSKRNTTQFLQTIQNLQKDSTLMQSFSAFKEHVLKDGSVLQQQAVNMNEILPQNTRYLMPS